jgi:hypothetical protein
LPLAIGIVVAAQAPRWHPPEHRQSTVCADGPALAIRQHDLNPSRRNS